MMNIRARVNGIEYSPFLCRHLALYPLQRIEEAFSTENAFLLETKSQARFAVSHWISPKRTRSYPYARVYDTLSYQGKRITVIPIIKDEGKEGDRDYLQYDTLPLMGLFGVYVVISYYKNAQKSQKQGSKITAQEFDYRHIQEELERLEKYQSDALHWNMQQIDRIGEIARKAIESYAEIEKRLDIKLHSFDYALKRLEIFKKNRDEYISHSRALAKEAQEREAKTLQPKEKINAQKATLTIENLLGGIYYFTCDEVYTEGDQITLVEAKHSKHQLFPSLEDIKDGLLRLALLTNLREVTVNQHSYSPRAILRLTSKKEFHSKTFLPANEIRYNCSKKKLRITIFM